MHIISQLLLRPSRLVSGLTVSFYGSVSSCELDSSLLSSEAEIDRIDEVYIRLGEFYDL